MALTRLRPPVAIVDLGLLTRLLCHEINNLVANQRGYTGLLLQRGLQGADAPRWLAEVARDTEELASLVAQVQTWTRSGAFADSGEADPWSDAPAERALLDLLISRGVDLPGIALQRLLTIVAQTAGAGLDEWQPIPPGQALPGLALLGTHDGRTQGVQLQIPLRSGPAALQAWHESAARILPGEGADAEAWKRSLVLGLLRQNGGELFQSDETGTPAALVLFLSVTELH